MIDRYTIKVAPAVSQKEVIKALNEATSLSEVKDLNGLKAGIELMATAEDIEKIIRLLKDPSRTYY